MDTLVKQPRKPTKRQTPTKRQLTAGEVANLLRVNVKVVHQWEAEGALPAGRTPNGGHRRFSVLSVREFMQANGFDERVLDEYLNPS